MEERLKIQILSSSEIDKGKWNNNLKKSPNSTIFQTSYYADFWEEYVGMKAFYCHIYDKESLVAQLLFFIDDEFRRYYFEKPFSTFVSSITKKWFPIFSWNHGPIIHRAEKKSETCEFLWKEITRFAKEHNVYKIKYTLPYSYQGVPFYDKKCKAETVLLNLDIEKEQLWRQLKHSTRKNIKKNKRFNIQATRAETIDDFLSYFDIIKESRTRNGLHYFSPRNVELWWKHWKMNNCFELFLAKEENRIVAGLGILYFDGYMTEMSSNQTNYCYEKKIPAGEAIKWEVIQWGRAQSIKVYDLAGINTKSEILKDKNIARFKLKWGGAICPYFNYQKKVGKLRSLFK